MRKLHMKIACCYDCPWMTYWREGRKPSIYFCGDACNNDETGKYEEDFEIIDSAKIPEWCPLPNSPKTEGCRRSE